MSEGDGNARQGRLEAFFAAVDALVTKVVPPTWLAAALVAAAGLSALLLVLLFLAFSRGSEEGTRAALRRLDRECESLRDSLAEKAAEAGKLASEIEAVRAELASEKRKADAARAESTQAARQASELRAELKAASEKLREVEALKRELQGKAEAVRLGETQVATLNEALEKAKRDLAAARKTVDERAEIVARGRKAFEAIVAAAEKEASPQKKLELMSAMIAESRAQLAPTPYLEEILSYAQKEKSRAEAARREAEREAAARAKEAYEAAQRALKVSLNGGEPHERQMALLDKAISELAGTEWQVKLSEEKRRLATEHAEAVAEAAWTALRERLVTRPSEFDANIAAAEEALAKTQGTRIAGGGREALTKLRLDRLEATGRAAYEEARARLDKSPRDYETNVAVLRELLAKARNSRYEAQIAEYLRKQETLLERQKSGRP
jgi:hypothetical protein